MTRQEKINKIYEVIADKTLSFGCVLDYYGDVVTSLTETYRFAWQKYHKKNRVTILYKNQSWFNMEITTDEFKVIWHPVMIGDVLDWMRENLLIEDWEDRQVGVCMEWNKKRKPIDNQPDDCIDFIYDLIEWVEQ